MDHLTWNDLMALEDDYDFVDPNADGFVVYQSINKINGKRYIGYTTRTVEKRWKAHLWDAKSGSKYFFHNAIRKYGEDSWYLEILETGNNTIYGLTVAEVFWICSDNPEYNSTLGGDGVIGLIHTVETRQKISKSVKLQVQNGTHNFVGARNPVHKQLANSTHNPHPKHYQMTFPDGHNETINNLAQFCRDHNLRDKTMRKVVKGTKKSYHGFKVTSF